MSSPVNSHTTPIQLLAQPSAVDTKIQHAGSVTPKYRTLVERLRVGVFTQKINDDLTYQPLNDNYKPLTCTNSNLKNRTFTYKTTEPQTTRHQKTTSTKTSEESNIDTANCRLIDQAEKLFASDQYLEALDTLSKIKTDDDSINNIALILKIKISIQLHHLKNANIRHLIQELKRPIKTLQHEFNTTIENHETITKDNTLPLINLLKARAQLYYTLNEIELAVLDTHHILQYYKAIFVTIQKNNDLNRKEQNKTLDFTFNIPEADSKSSKATDVPKKLIKKINYDAFDNQQKDDPEYHETLLMIGKIQVDGDDFIKATQTFAELASYNYQPQIVQCYQKYLSLKPTDSESIKQTNFHLSSIISKKDRYYSIALKLRIMTYFQAGNLDYASQDLELYNKIADAKARSKDLPTLKARIRLALHTSIKALVELIEKIKEGGGNYKQIECETFNYYFQRNDFKTALFFLEKIKHDFSSNTFKIYSAITYLMNGKPHEAINDLENIQNENIDNIKPLYCENLTLAYFLIGQYSETLRVAKMATAIYPQNDYFYLYSIASFLALGQSENATRTVQILFALFPQPEGLKNAIKQLLIHHNKFSNPTNPYFEQALKFVQTHIEESTKEGTLTKLDKLPYQQFSEIMSDEESKLIKEVTGLASTKLEVAFITLSTFINTAKSISATLVLCYTDLYQKLTGKNHITLSPPLFCVQSLLTYCKKTGKISPLLVVKAHFALAHMHFGNYNKPEAIKELQIIAGDNRLKDSQAKALFQLGEIAFWNNEYEAAETILKDCPEFSHLVFCYFETLLFFKDPNQTHAKGKVIIESLEKCEKNTKIGQKNIHELLGLMHYALGNLDQAKKHLETALSAGELVSNTLILRAKIACQSSIEKGLATFETLKLRGGDISSAHSDLVDELFNEKKFSILLKLLNELLKLYPYNAHYLAFRALCHFHLNNPQECLNDITNVVSLNKNVYRENQLSMSKAIALYKSKKYEEALDECKVIIKTEKESPLHLIQLACYTDMGKRNEAKEMLENFQLIDKATFKTINENMSSVFFNGYSDEAILNDPYLSHVLHFRDTLCLNYAEKVFWRDTVEEAKPIFEMLIDPKCKPTANGFLQTIRFLEIAKPSLDDEKTFSQISKLLGSNPRSTEKRRFHELVARTTYKLNKIELAKKHLEAASKFTHSDHHIIVLRAKIACHTSAQAALAVIQNRKIHRNNIDAIYTQLVKELFAEARYGLLLPLLNKLIEEDFENVYYLEIRGRCYLELKELDKSLKDFSQIKLLDKTSYHKQNIDIYKSQAFYALEEPVIKLYQLKKYDEALKQCEAIIKRDPESRLQLIKFACYTFLHKIDDVKRMIQELKVMKRDRYEAIFYTIDQCFFEDYKEQEIAADPYLKNLKHLFDTLFPGSQAPSE